MQTFLPYPDFTASARVLDYKRLGKQRVEAKQILNALTKTSGGWVNHPATKMWRGYEDALKLYANTMIAEWIRRGYNNTMPYYIVHEVALAFSVSGTRVIEIKMPPWLGDEDLHRSHRANLLRKDPDHYSQYFNEDPTLPYIWPVQ